VIARGTTTTFHNLIARVDLNGATGHGEAAPAPAVTGENLDASLAALEAWARDPNLYEAEVTVAERAPGGHARPAARSAAIAAYLDAIGQRTSRSLRRLLNLPAGRVASDVTLSVGPVEEVLSEAAVRATEGWPAFKVKLGGDHDEAVLLALRDQYPDVPLRVDANEAWSRQVAEQRLTLLDRLGVELVEQPLPRDRLDDMAALARRFQTPLFLDESVHDTQDLVEALVRDACAGVNIKLAKCGGPFEARRMVKMLRDHGLKVMMGCMLETSLGIATAAAFAGTLDHADFDGAALLAHDPFEGLPMHRGMCEAPDTPGIGVRPRPGHGLGAADPPQSV
jgi:L-Ala-D/L-Glu epimerase